MPIYLGTIYVLRGHILKIFLFYPNLPLRKDIFITIKHWK